MRGRLSCTANSTSNTMLDFSASSISHFAFSGGTADFDSRWCSAAEPSEDAPDANADEKKRRIENEFMPSPQYRHRQWAERMWPKTSPGLISIPTQHRTTHFVVEFTQIATSKTSSALVRSRSRSRMQKGICGLNDAERRATLRQGFLGLRLARWGSPALYPRLSKSAATPLEARCKMQDAKWVMKHGQSNCSGGEPTNAKWTVQNG